MKEHCHGMITFAKGGKPIAISMMGNKRKCIEDTAKAVRSKSAIPILLCGRPFYFHTPEYGLLIAEIHTCSSKCRYEEYSSSLN